MKSELKMTLGLFIALSGGLFTATKLVTIIHQFLGSGSPVSQFELYLFIGLFCLWGYNRMVMKNNKDQTDKDAKVLHKKTQEALNQLHITITDEYRKEIEKRMGKILWMMEGTNKTIETITSSITEVKASIGTMNQNVLMLASGLNIKISPFEHQPFVEDVNKT